MLNAVRDADSNSLPEIVREIRSCGEDFQYYAPPQQEVETAHPNHKTSFANDTTGSPLVELGKVMGTLQLEEGQVSLIFSGVDEDTLFWADVQLISCLTRYAIEPTTQIDVRAHTS